MISLRSFPQVLPLLLLPGLLAAGLAIAADATPDFTGVWVFNEQRSDDLRARVEEAVGPETTRGDIKKDVVRVWIRQWLLGVLEDPESRYLTIEQSPETFKSGVGDDVSVYYFGREAASRGPAGGTLRVKVYWKDAQLITEETAGDGGRITAVYTLLPGDATLLIAYRLEHKSLKKPLEVAMFFDRENEGD